MQKKHHHKIALAHLQQSTFFHYNSSYGSGAFIYRHQSIPRDIRNEGSTRSRIIANRPNGRRSPAWNEVIGHDHITQHIPHPHRYRKCNYK